MARARLWQPPGASQLMEMAGLPSDQVTMVAVVRVSGSVPGVLLASALATARLARPSATVQRTVSRAFNLLSPLRRRGRTWGRPLRIVAATGFQPTEEAE